MRKSIVVTLLMILVFAFIPAFATADMTERRSLWLRTRGFVTQWGEDPAFGWVNAQVRMIDNNGTYREWARVHATWSTDIPHINNTEPPAQNLTLIHYSAKLVNTTDVEFNYTGFDLYVAGLWNVSKITINITILEGGTVIFTRTVEPLLDLADGEFRVYPWTPHVGRRFELAIVGTPMLSGFIVRYDLRYVEIKLFDINDDGKVDIWDIVKVAKKWKLAPGLGHYNEDAHDADVDFDDQIGIGDLATVAANIEA